MVLRDIRTQTPEINAIIGVVVENAPDVLVLTDIDYDYDWFALRAFQSALEAKGAPFEFIYTAPVNAGLDSGFDFDGDGRFGEPEDAQGWGRFAGDGGLAVLSRFEIVEEDVEVYSYLLWHELENAQLPQPASESAQHQRLSSTGHWIVPVLVNGQLIDLMVYAATPPVFDGPEDRNGLRNRDELRLWEQIIAKGRENPFILIGNTNLDPRDGDGLTHAMAVFLKNPAITDPQPSSQGGRLAADPDHFGDAAMDTADWPDGEPGNLRVSYILPSAELNVARAGVFWPAPDDPQRGLIGDDGLAAGAHRLVWVDIVP